MAYYCFYWNVALWQNKTETLETRGANSHVPLRCPPHLRANGQLFQVLNCPQLGWGHQIKQTRILKLEYQLRTKETTSPRTSRVEATQKAGTRLAIFFYLFFLGNVMHKRDDFYCNKVLLLFLQCCFILQSNRLPEPDKLSKNNLVISTKLKM